MTKAPFRPSPPLTALGGLLAMAAGIGCAALVFWALIGPRPDWRAAVETLVDGGWDAVWTVSETDSKAHPLKQLTIGDGRLLGGLDLSATLLGGGTMEIGGPSPDGRRWVATPRRYLVSAEALRAAYRRHFLAGLARLKRKGLLRLEGDFARLRDAAEWSAFLDQLQSTEWVSYIEPPPGDASDARAVSISPIQIDDDLEALETGTRDLRETLEEITSFGNGGRQPGQFYGVHSIAMDSRGNLYTTETYEGKRIQKFNYKGIRTVSRGYQGVPWPARN